MRTTLTLEPAVADKLKQMAARDGRSFKAVVNEALRRGLEMEPTRRRQRFRVKTFSSAFAGGVDPAQLNRLADDLAVETWLETPSSRR